MIVSATLRNRILVGVCCLGGGLLTGECRAQPVLEAPEPAPAPVEIELAEPKVILPSEGEPGEPEVAKPLTREQRLESLKTFGGTAETDAAVFAGLDWLKTQQQPDGSWSFDKVKAGSKAGTLRDCTTGATGLALLAYLGVGQTHLHGDYRQTVYNGLLYLMKQADSEENAADLRSGEPAHARMYAHCIASRALCEAYGLAKGQLKDGLPGEEGREPTDRERREERRMVVLLRQFEAKLKSAAQLSVNFIVMAQDKTGGWRYEPRRGADMSVTSWATMALHTGYAAGLAIPTAAIRGANLYLNRVQVGDGAQYGYTDSTPNRPGTSAAGLLCRMHLDRKHPGIPKGIEYLDLVGPSLNNMYFNHYATQVLHHWGGEEWEKWNERNREMLVRGQRTQGAARGSWPAAGGHAALGGDFLQTCLCVLTLETYLREPIYRRNAKADDE